MSANALKSRPRRLRGLAIAATMAAALGLTTGGSSAAPEDRVAASVQAQASSRPPLDCGNGAGPANRFEVERASGGVRVIEICNAADGARLAETARALSRAMDASSAQLAVVRHPLAPELVGLRLMRARTEVDESLGAHARNRIIAGIDRQIRELDYEISTTAERR